MVNKAQVEVGVVTLEELVGNMPEWSHLGPSGSAVLVAYCGAGEWPAANVRLPRGENPGPTDRAGRPRCPDCVRIHMARR